MHAHLEKKRSGFLDKFTSPVSKIKVNHKLRVGGWMQYIACTIAPEHQTSKDVKLNSAEHVALLYIVTFNLLLAGM